MTLCTLLSRVTGLVRTWAMAFALGNTLLTSAYQVAYNLPVMIYEFAASGILVTGFLPIYLLQKEKEGEQAAYRFSSNILTLTLIALGVVSLLCSVFAPAVIETQTFTIGNGEEKTLAIFFFRVFAIQILLYGLGAIISGVLNAERTFTAPFIAPVINNIIVIITMFGFVPLSAWNPTFAMWWLAIGTSLGVLCQFGIQIPTLIKQGFKFTPHINLHDPMLKEALRVALPVFIYIAGTAITFSCRNAFALGAASNGPSTLSYAWMWYQLPYGVISVSIATAMLTELSECAAKEDWKGFRFFVRSGLRSTFFTLIPLATAVGCLALPIIQLFQVGAFSAEDTITVSTILSVWVISLPFYAGYMYMYRIFGALRDLFQFAVIDFAMRIVLALLYAVLTQPDVLGLIGIPIADLIFYGSMFLIRSTLLQKKIGKFGGKGIAEIFIKTLAASAVGAVVMIGITQGLSFVLPAEDGLVIASAIVKIALAGIVGLVVIFGICKLMKIPEFSVLSRIGNRLLGLIKRNKTA